jgi:hypothetical protein
LQGNAHFVDEHTLALDATTVRLKPSPPKNCDCLRFTPYHPADVDFSTRAFTTATRF